MKQLPGLAPEEKRGIGGEANVLKQEFEAAFAARHSALDAAALMEGTGGRDLTMPGRDRARGGIHPVTRVVEEIVSIFHGLGFARATGPEVETEWYNFGALNFPSDHPAMDMHDTLYLDLVDGRTRRDRRRNRTSGISEPHERRDLPDRRVRDEGRWLMRTHTSPVQIRVMLTEPPPLRVVIPGWAYRKDTFDASTPRSLPRSRGSPWMKESPSST